MATKPKPKPKTKAKKKRDSNEEERTLAVLDQDEAEDEGEDTPDPSLYHDDEGIDLEAQAHAYEVGGQSSQRVVPADQRVIDQLLSSYPAKSGFYLKILREVGTQWEYKNRIDEYDNWVDLELEVSNYVRERTTREGPRRWGSGRYMIVIGRDGGLRQPWKYPRHVFVVDAQEREIDYTGNTVHTSDRSVERDVTERIQTMAELFKAMGITPGANQPNMQDQLMQISAAFQKGMEISSNNKGSETNAITQMMSQQNNGMFALVTALMGLLTNNQNQQTKDVTPPLDPQENLASTIRLFSHLKDLMPRPEKQKNILEQMAEFKALGFEPFKKEDPMESIKGMGGLMQTLMSVMKPFMPSPEPVEKPTITERLIDAGMEKLPDLFTKGAEIMKAKAMSEATQLEREKLGKTPRMISRQPVVQSSPIEPGAHTIDYGQDYDIPNSVIPPQPQTIYDQPSQPVRGGMPSEELMRQEQQLIENVVNAINTNDQSFFPTIVQLLRELPQGMGVMMLQQIQSGQLEVEGLQEAMYQWIPAVQRACAPLQVSTYLGQLIQYVRIQNQRSTGGAPSTPQADESAEPVNVNGVQGTVIKQLPEGHVFVAECTRCPAVTTYNTIQDYYEDNAVCGDEGPNGDQSPCQGQLELKGSMEYEAFLRETQDDSIIEHEDQGSTQVIHEPNQNRDFLPGQDLYRKYNPVVESDANEQDQTQTNGFPPKNMLQPRPKRNGRQKRRGMP